MVFSDFTQSTSDLTITLRNYDALLNVTEIKFYKESTTGTFTKKEFRWGTKHTHFSSWQKLTQQNFGCIDPKGKETLFIELRYVLTSEGSGKVKSFVVNYLNEPSAITAGTVTTIPQKVVPTIVETGEPVQELPFEKVEPKVAESSPIYDPSANISTTPVNEPKYSPKNERESTTKTTSVTDADTLDCKTPDYYLWRPYQKGTQPISTVQGLQTVLNNITGNLQNSIFNADNVDGAGIGVLYSETNHDLLFKRITGGSDINISEDVNGIITINTNLSVDSTDVSIADLQVQIDNISIYIDSQFFNIDSSLNYIIGNFIPEASLGTGFYWNGPYLDVSVVGGSGGDSSTVNSSLDYGTYEPLIGDTSIFRTGELVTQIVTINNIGTKQVDFTYDVNDLVTQVDVSNYGIVNRIVTFERDANDNVIAVHVN